MRTAMLLAVTLALCALGPAVANPILFAPTGMTLTTGQFRAEAALSPGNDDGKYFWFGAGLMQFEANLIHFDNPNGDDQNLIGAQWSFLPETSLTPGVGLGVWDIADESPEGIGAYVAVTKRLPTDMVLPLLRDVSATVGVGVGGIRGPFAGVEAKLPLGFFVQAEYDSRDFNAAGGWAPIKLLRLKAYTLDGDFFYGAELTPISF